jgi:hypothetical protein
VIKPPAWIIAARPVKQLANVLKLVNKKGRAGIKSGSFALKYFPSLI